MKLSILMPCLKTRNWRLMDRSITEQISIAGLEKNVEFIYLEDNGETPSGAKRNELTSMASGEYLCFVDDDDRVSKSYVSTLFKILEADKSIDVVAFALRISIDNKREEKWQFGDFPNNRRQGKMSMNHLCVWRSEIAKRVAWCPDVGFYDDHLWFEPMQTAHKGELKVVQISDVLYLYDFDSTITKQQTKKRREFTKRYIGNNGLRCFKNSKGEILIEESETIRTGVKNPKIVYVRDKNLKRSKQEIKNLKYFHTIKQPR